MKKFLLGLLIAVVIASGVAAYVITASQPAAAQHQQAEQQGVNCSWGQIKLCFAGHCVPGCCDENCKGSP